MMYAKLDKINKKQNTWLYKNHSPGGGQKGDCREEGAD
jgi:hypothetical protein